MVWELHQTYYPPKACFNEDYGATSHVTTLVVDDPDFVQQARNFGLPAFLGSISLAKDEQPGVTTWNWWWQVEGNPKSNFVNVVTSPLPHHSSMRDLSRLAWFPEAGGVTYFDTTFVGAFDSATQPIVYGTIASPMVYANAGSPLFPGLGSIREGAYSATMYRFGDFECKNPIDS